MYSLVVFEACKVRLCLLFRYTGFWLNGCCFFYFKNIFFLQFFTTVLRS